MANISDLAHRPSAAIPPWIAALSRASKFVAGPAGSRPTPRPRDETGAAQQEAIEAAYRRGWEEGAASARAEHEADAQSKERLALEFARLDDAAIAALGQHLAQTVARLCEQVIAPHQLERERVAARCAQLAKMIGEAPAHCRLYLHPEDAALLDEAALGGWTICPDPALARGSLQLEGREGIVRDGPEEWRRAFLKALEG